jgi:hypothetical protein
MSVRWNGATIRRRPKSPRSSELGICPDRVRCCGHEFMRRCSERGKASQLIPVGMTYAQLLVFLAMSQAIVAGMNVGYWAGSSTPAATQEPLDFQSLCRQFRQNSDGSWSPVKPLAIPVDGASYKIGPSDSLPKRKNTPGNNLLSFSTRNVRGAR